MAANAYEQTLLSGGGTLATSGVKTKACKAFRAAVKRWCGRKTKAKEFNDVFYNELRNTKKYGDLASRLARETPVLMQGTIQSGGIVAASAAFGGLGAALPAGAQACWKAMTTAAGPIAGNANAAFGTAAGAANTMLTAASAPSGFYRRFLEGVLDGNQVVEIKGPGDKFHDAQASDLKEINNGKDPIVLSCQSCGAKCKNNGGGRARGC